MHIINSSKEDILDHLDALPITTIVCVFVFLAGRKVVNADPVNDHGVGALVVVDLTTRPLNGTQGVTRVTGGPDTKTNVTRGLGEVLSVQSVFVFQSADQFLIQPPLHLLLGPVSSIVVKLGVGVGDVVVTAAVVARVVSFAVVVGLHLGGVVTDPFPVNLVQVVGLQDNTADNTTTLGHLDVSLDNTEEDKELGLQRGGVQLLLDGEFGSVLGPVDFAIGRGPDVLVLGSVENPRVVRTQSRVSRTVLLGRVTVGEGLGVDGGDTGQQQADEEAGEHGDACDTDQTKETKESLAVGEGEQIYCSIIAKKEWLANRQRPKRSGSALKRTSKE